MDFLSEISKKLDLPPGEKAEVLKELESHYREVQDELTTAGMDADSVDQEAARRLGDPQDIASRLQTVHCQATWRTALLTAFPFVCTFLGTLHYPLAERLFHLHATKTSMYSCQISLLVLCAGLCFLMLRRGIWEMISGRRPIWLATWMAVATYEVVAIFNNFRNLASLSGSLPMPVYPPGSTTPVYLGIPTPICPIDLSGPWVYVVVFMGIDAARAFRRSPYWALPLVGCVALAEFVFGLMPSDPGWLVARFAILVLLYGLPLTAVAMGVFARHPYGNTAYASLFLFAFFAVTAYGDGGQWTPIYITPWPTLIMAGTTIAYARAGTWRRKTGILAGVLRVAIFAGFVFEIGTEESMYAIMILVCAVIVPALFARRWTEQRPEIVS